MLWSVELAGKEVFMSAPLPLGWYPDSTSVPERLGVPPPKETRSTPIPATNRSKSGRRARYSRPATFRTTFWASRPALKTTQLLYRSTSQTGKPTVNVTSIIQPADQPDTTRIMSYQSAYDSLNRNDQPSYAIYGRPDIRRPRSQCRAGGLRTLSRAGLHGDRAGHRRPAGRLRRGPRVRDEHPRLDPRRVQCVGGRDRERRERRVCSATPAVRSPANGPPNSHRPTRPTSTPA